MWFPRRPLRSATRPRSPPPVAPSYIDRLPFPTNAHRRATPTTVYTLSWCGKVCLGGIHIIIYGIHMYVIDGPINFIYYTCLYNSAALSRCYYILYIHI